MSLWTWTTSMNSLPHLGTLPDWSAAQRVGLDIETRDDHLKTLGPGVRREGYVTGVSFAIEDGPSFYLPMRHQGGGNYDNPERVIAYLRYQAENFKGILVGANMQYDLDYLAELGIVFAPKFFRDIQVSGPLLDRPNVNGVPNRMSLDAQAKRWGLPGKDESRLHAFAEAHGINAKNEMWKMPAWEVEEYAIADAILPLKILRKHEREIDDQDLWQIYDMESRLLPVLLKMRRRGVAVDLDKLEQVEHIALEREQKALSEASRLSGVRLVTEDIAKSGAVAKCLEGAGIKVPKLLVRISDKTGKEIGGGPSVTSPWLETVNHPVATAVREARKWNKIRNTFCKSVRTHEIKGRLHCTFNQLKHERADGEMKGAQYGRMSSSQLNIQQQPARDDEIGPLWRSIYIPDEGGVWACLDYSGQEPRWITHYAELAECEGGAQAAEMCRTDPSWDNHSMMAAMMYDNFVAADLLSDDASIVAAAKHLRGNAKTIFLGLCYGMGGGKLCLDLGLPIERVITHYSHGREVEVAGPEGRSLIERFHENVPYVRQLTRLVQNKAKRVGHIMTAYGRCCRFPRTENVVEWAHLGLNRLIQGTSGDQTKLALIAADDAGFNVQIQVHDELDLTIYNPAEAEELAHIMCNVMPCNVPTVVDNEQGPNWGSLKKVA